MTASIDPPGEDVLTTPTEPSHRRTDNLYRTETVWRAELPSARPSRGSRFAALVRAIGSLLMLVLVLVGLPVGLVEFVGWPLPRTVPTSVNGQMDFPSGGQ